MDRQEPKSGFGSRNRISESEFDPSEVGERDKANFPQFCRRMIKAIIIDDEEGARITLNALLTDFCQDVQVLELCSNVPDGVRAINRLNPDVVFLDIEMPDYNGFELPEFFREINFEIVFVTAYSQYAIKAFEVSAIDYLLKPVEIGQLQNAIEKVKIKAGNRDIIHRLELMKETYKGEEVRKIALPMSDGLIFVETADILYFEADRVYTHVFLRNGSRLTVSKPLRTFEEVLQEKPTFYRPHRSYLINLNCMTRYQRGDGMITLENGQLIGISREKKQEFEQVLRDLKLTI
jgi:two-component system LytT family response regulator